MSANENWFLLGDLTTSNFPSFTEHLTDLSESVIRRSPASEVNIGSFIDLFTKIITALLVLIRVS